MIVDFYTITAEMEIVKRQKMKYLIKKKKQEEKMSESILITRNVPIRYTVDVCVTGAGPGGIAAAVVAASAAAVSVMSLFIRFPPFVVIRL